MNEPKKIQNELDELMRVIQIERSGAQLMTVEEVAYFLNVDEQNVRYHMRNGSMPHYRIGRLMRISPSQLQRWLERNEHHPRPTPSEAADDFSRILSEADEGWV